MRARLLAFAIASITTAASQDPSPAPVRVTFETTLGAITAEIDLARAPLTGANFLAYVDGKFYDGGAVNRAVRPDNTTRHDVEIQVIQFQIDPARRRDQFPPIPLERTSVTNLKHVNGALSMARSGPDTATASFSIVIGDQPEMDFGGKRNPDGQGFAVFGRVIRRHGRREEDSGVAHGRARRVWDGDARPDDRDCQGVPEVAIPASTGVAPSTSTKALGAGATGNPRRPPFTYTVSRSRIVRSTYTGSDLHDDVFGDARFVR